MPLTGLPPLVLAERLAIAALIGLAVGTEREWSAPPTGPRRGFAGLRTFLLFGMGGGAAGILFEANLPIPAAILLASAAALNVAAYVMTVRRPDQPLDGTTEAAALVVLSLGVLAALGYLTLATGCAAVVVFALGEKERLHRLVARIGQREMHAALVFMVLALVVLPVLPAGPYPALLDFRPRELWGFVLLLSGLNFASYLARRSVGPGKGYGATGALAGLISSTLLTLQFSRISRSEPQHARALGLGVVAACALLPLRLLAVSIVLNPLVARELLFYTIPAAVAGVGFTLLLLRHSSSVEAPAPEPENPLHLWSALQMAVVLEVTFVAIGYARAHWGGLGLAGSSVVFGLTDMDALTVSMNRLPGGPAVAAIAGRGVGIGLATNTVVKLGIALMVGQREFRRIAAPGLVVTALLLLAMIWWRW
jgi:uncharacterized membrane protein (DUF4010 family)